MLPKIKKEASQIYLQHRRLVITILVIILATVTLVIALQSQRHFYRRSIRQLETGIKSLGSFAPIAVIGLISLSVAVPPLPIPIPLIEIASGLVFGFGSGFILSWIAQIISSILGFYLARYFGKKIVNRFFSKYKFLEFYKSYLERSGPVAIFITRALMVSPFNIVSYLAGLTSMNIISFSIATIFGTIPEALLYSFIGSIIRTTRLSLAYVFVLVIIVAALGLIATFIMLEIATLREKKKLKNF